MSTITLTTRDIYGCDDPPIPDGYEAGDLILCGEPYDERIVLLRGRRAGDVFKSCCLEYGTVRLELRKKPAMVRWFVDCEEGKTPIVFVPTGENRTPKIAEFFLNFGGNPQQLRIETRTPTS